MNGYGPLVFIVSPFRLDIDVVCALSVLRFDFWLGKVVVNRKRDRRVSSVLRRRGWTVFRIKECELKSHEPTVAWLKRIQVKP
jgi:G:T-mismatch repair DNA endonuclease (very short patch repair protein)